MNRIRQSDIEMIKMYFSN